MDDSTPPRNPARPPVAALATAPGAAGIAVVRLSGEGALAIADRLCPGARTPPSALPAGSFRLVRLRDPRDGSAIDEALVLVFRAPHSYTGEDVVEFQTHGGRAAPSRVLDSLLALGAAPAGPGEFTRRAFLNGRVALDRAEAVMDLVSAQGDRAARAAAEQLSGALGRRVDAIWEDLLALCADVEATLDFTDDEAEGLAAPIRFDERAAAIAGELRALAATSREGRLLREGALVVLAGPPNAGKSTLFNRLLGERRAIVAPEAGTTRDSLEETLLLRGIPIRLVDTAGLRETGSAVEREGVERARGLAARADLVLELRSVERSDGPAVERSEGTKVLEVETKIDLRPCDRVTVRPCDRVTRGAAEPLRVSAVTGEGVAELEDAILAALGANPASSGDGVAASERHAALLREAADAVDAARAAFAEGAEAAAVPAADRLRDAAESLARITGRSYTESLLDAVFGKFCVGK
jgi:tRNA modification GTPase